MFRKDIISPFLTADHRTSCHRCGNIRKNLHECTECPQVFCNRCTEKMMVEHGVEVFNNGCPVCKDLCCCGLNKSLGCTRQFHCYKKCPTTRPGGVNFGVCTPSPSNGIKFVRSQNRRVFQRSESEAPASSADYNDNHHMSIPAIASQQHTMNLVSSHLQEFSDPSGDQYCASGGTDVEDPTAGLLRNDHGSVDDIEHFFISADDWDRSQFTGNSRFYDQQQNSSDGDFLYGTTSSASEENAIVYVDNSIKDMFPFLSTPTPTSPQIEASPICTSPLPVERTSSLPLPSTQAGYYYNARHSDDATGNPAIDTEVPIEQQVDNCTLVLEEAVSNAVSSSNIGIFNERSEIDQSIAAANNENLRGYFNQPTREFYDVSISNERLESLRNDRAVPVVKKGQRGRPPKHQNLHDLEQEIDHEFRTGIKGKSKKARNGATDNLLVGPNLPSSIDSNLGPLEGFLSSNYFIKESLNEQTGPFFLQQSLYCHPRALSLRELVGGATTVGGLDNSAGLGPNGKKRYRKHPASISANKAKHDSQYTQSSSHHGFQNQGRTDAMPQSFAKRTAEKDGRQSFNNRHHMSTNYDEDSYASSQARDIWAALQGNCFEDDGSMSKGSRPVVRDLIAQSDRSLLDVPPTSSHTVSRYASVSTDYGDDNDEGKGGGNAEALYREERESSDKERSPRCTTDNLSNLRTTELNRNGRAINAYGDAVDANKGPGNGNPEAQRAHRLGHGLFVKDNSKETPYLGIFDPFQKFDDFYAIGPAPGIPAADLATAMGSSRSWTYDYFQSDAAHKVHPPAQPCSPGERFKCQEVPILNNSTNSAIGGNSPHRANNTVDIDAEADELLMSTFGEHIKEYSEIPASHITLSATHLLDNRKLSGSVPLPAPINRHFRPESSAAGSDSLMSIMGAAQPSNLHLMAGHDSSQMDETLEHPVAPISIPKIPPTCYGYSSGMTSPSPVMNIAYTYQQLDRPAPTDDPVEKPLIAPIHPLLESISFSPFMNFTPESEIKLSRLDFGSDGSMGKTTFGISTSLAINEEDKAGEKSRESGCGSNDISPGDPAILSLTNTEDCNVGWLDDAFSYDFVAE